ncbi:MAG: hypothetical protein ACPGYT_08215, partial [Nitrospirales bacterium]
ILNGGSKGRKFLERYFSLCGIVGLWAIIPFQILLALPTFFKSLADSEWFIPLVTLITNILIFGTVAVQIRAVAKAESRLTS